MTIRNKTEKLRFAAVGSANTLIDFSVLFTLSALGVPTVVANLVSTSAAFCFSFFANKKYTFRSSNGDLKREILLFVIVTLFGLWVIQTIVIKLVQLPLTSYTDFSDGAILFIAKIFATISSLVWNYTLYSRVVFKQKGDK